MQLYVDTSAAAKLLLVEPESDALRSYLRASGAELMSSQLLITELHRAVAGVGGSADAANTLLGQISMLPLEEALLHRAGRLRAAPGTVLRTLDAIHLAAALELVADGLLTYDTRLTHAAFAEGLPVVAPA